MNPPVSLVCVPTKDAQIYDVQITIISNDSPEEIFSKTVIRFVASKKKAMERKNIRYNVRPVELKAKVSALHCKIEWPEFVNYKSGDLKLRLCSNGVWNTVQAKPNSNTFDILTVPGRNYFLEFRKYNNNKKLLRAGDVWFKASKLIAKYLR